MCEVHKVIHDKKPDWMCMTKGIGYVYVISNTKSNNIYIGSTDDTIKIRFKSHINTFKLKNSGLSEKTTEAYNIFFEDYYGTKIEIMEIVDTTIHKLKERESEYMYMMENVINAQIPSKNVLCKCGIKYSGLCAHIASDEHKEYLKTIEKQIPLSNILISVRELTDNKKIDSYICVNNNFINDCKSELNRRRFGNIEYYNKLYLNWSIEQIKNIIYEEWKHKYEKKDSDILPEKKKSFALDARDRRYVLFRKINKRINLCGLHY
jgi:hypothetical protein